MDNQRIFIALLAVVIVLFVFGFMPSVYQPSTLSSSRLEVLEMNQNASTAQVEIQPVDKRVMEPISLAGHPQLGDYFTDTVGRALYTTTKKDCSGSCLKVWLPYIANGTVTGGNSKLSVVKNEKAGVLQYAFNGKLLYYYAEDEKPGDVKGHGIGGVWSLAK